MQSFTTFNNNRDARKMTEHLITEADSCGFEPDLVLFYATQKYARNYGDILNRLHNHFGDIPSIGGSVDGMLYPHDLRTDGAMLVLYADDKSKIRVVSAHGQSTSENVERVTGEVSCKQGAVMLHFPIIHIPTTAASLAMVARGKYYSRRCRNADSPQEARDIALRFSKYLDNNNFTYPLQDIIMPVAKACKEKIPVIGAGLVHARMKTNTPNVFANFQDIEAGIAALVVEKPNTITCYDDIFLDRGESIEASIESAKRDINFVKEYNAIFIRNILISLDERLAGDEFSKIMHENPDIDDAKLVELDKGTYDLHKPYGLSFINPETKGLFFMGAGDYYPFDVFPEFVDLDIFSDKVHLCRESIIGRHMDFISTLSQVPGSDFNLFFIDAGSIPAFGTQIYDYMKEVQLRLINDYAGLMIAPPAAFLPPEFQRRKYITEIAPKLFFSSSGSNACLEF